jgi:hypothetical protein
MEVIIEFMNLLFGNSTVCLRQGELIPTMCHLDFKFTSNPNFAHFIDESQNKVRLYSS